MRFCRKKAEKTDAIENMMKRLTIAKRPLVAALVGMTAGLAMAHWDDTSFPCHSGAPSRVIPAPLPVSFRA